MILLGLIIYIFGILLTDAVLDAVVEAESLQIPLPENGSGENVAHYFGTLYRSIVTLFRTISNGVTWQNPDDLLVGMNSLGEFWAQIYRFYIAFCSFAVLNAPRLQMLEYRFTASSDLLFFFFFLRGLCICLVLKTSLLPCFSWVFWTRLCQTNAVLATQIVLCRSIYDRGYCLILLVEGCSWQFYVWSVLVVSTAS